MPFKLRLVGSRVVVLDDSGNPYVHVLDANTGDLLASYGGTGKGPGDFQSPGDMLSYPGHRDRAWIFDFALKRITEIDLGDHIFALFSGRPYELGDYGFEDWGRHVHVFDWSGTYVTGFGLDVDGAISIAVDWEGRKMWSSHLAPAPQIRVHHIEDLPAARERSAGS